jgi:phage gp46-like protein
MTDLSLQWDDELYAADFALKDGALVTDDGLRTAVIISLFTDKRAALDDVLPQPSSDRRGWWGDMLSAQGWEIGSRLWLLAREKQLPAVLVRAEAYAREALQWMVDDGVAVAISVSARFPRNGWLQLEIGIDRPSGPDRERYDFVWNAVSRELGSLT